MPSYVMLFLGFRGQSCNYTPPASCRSCKNAPQWRGIDTSAGTGGRPSIRAPVQNGLVGLVLVRKVDRLVLAQREIDVAQHLAAARALALDMHRKGVAVTRSAHDRAESEERVDVARCNLHARNAGVGCTALAGLIFRICARDREIVLTEHWCCKRCDDDNAEQSGCDFEHPYPLSRDTEWPSPTVLDAGRAANGQGRGLVPRTRSSRAICCEFDRELRVSKGH